MKPKTIGEEDFVPEGWTGNEKSMTVAEWGQREYGMGRTTGEADGVRKAMLFVMAKATKLFENGKTNAAIAMRDLANAIKEEVK